MKGIEHIQVAASRIQRNLRGILLPYRDKDPDPAKSVFLCGAPRSGTTWLADLLNYSNGYRLLYEPFSGGPVPLCRPFLARQYLRPDDDNRAYLEPARAIFSGRIRNPWIDQYNRCRSVQRRLIKDVRSNLMLKWIRNHFPETPIIFLVRHPCAVAVSRQKLGYPIDLREKVFFPQEALMADYLAPFAEQITWANTPFERHVVDWCIENFIPFAQLNKGDVYLAFYENLIADPREELRRLFDFLKQPFDESALSQFHKPSATSRRKGDMSAILSGASLIDGWRKQISADQLTAATRITAQFGLDQIYVEGSIADAQNAESLLKAGSRSGLINRRAT